MCRRRIVTAHSVLLFHQLKWESGEHIDISEAAEWARHFAYLEQDMDGVLARLLGISADKLAAWTKPGRYVTGRELQDFYVVSGIPHAVLIDRQGKVRLVRIGSGDQNAADLRRAIEECLAESATSQ